MTVIAEALGVSATAQGATWAAPQPLATASGRGVEAASAAAGEGAAVSALDGT